MNSVWTFVVIISLLFSLFSGFPQNVLTSGVSGAEGAVKVLISLAGAMCFWSGILRIAEKGGAAQKCQKLLSPVIKRLFPTTGHTNKIMMNIVANLFGTGNAATPAGVAAMEGMDEENGKSPYPSREMCRFTIMNTASLQLFPTTVISILSSFGAKNPLSIVPYVWISSSMALICALLVQSIFSKRR